MRPIRVHQPSGLVGVVDAVAVIVVVGAMVAQAIAVGVSRQVGAIHGVRVASGLVRVGVPIAVVVGVGVVAHPVAVRVGGLVGVRREVVVVIVDAVVVGVGVGVVADAVIVGIGPLGAVERE